MCLCFGCGGVGGVGGVGAAWARVCKGRLVLSLSEL